MKVSLCDMTISVSANRERTRVFPDDGIYTCVPTGAGLYASVCITGEYECHRIDHPVVDLYRSVGDLHVGWFVEESNDKKE